MLVDALAITLGLLPGFAWLIFYLTEDPHPEPKRLVLFTFVAGIAFGFFAIIAEQFWSSLGEGIGFAEFSILSLIGLAVIEELTKFAAAYFSISRTPEIQDPIDPMIYMIVAALGFATLENIGTLLNLPNGNLWNGAFQAVSLRFVGATLLHTLTSGIIGYHWSLGIAKRRPAHFLASGFIFAIIVHVAFNYFIINFANVGYAILLLLVVGFFVLNDFEELRAKEEHTRP